MKLKVFIINVGFTLQKKKNKKKSIFVKSLQLTPCHAN